MLSLAPASLGGVHEYEYPHCTDAADLAGHALYGADSTAAPH